VKLTSDGVSAVPGLTASFSPAAVPTNGASLFNVVAAATTKAGTYSLTVLGNLGNVTRTVTLYLVVPDTSIRLSATTLTFANQIVATTSAAKTITLTNTSKSTLTFSGISVKGPYDTTNTCGTSVKAGASCTISVTFTPRAVGAGSGLITITDSDTTSPQKITLTGNGLGAGKLNISPKVVSFGPDTVGTPVTKTLTLKNTGTATLTLTGMTISGTEGGDFKKSSGCGNTIAVAATCTVDVTFTPTAKGARAGTLSISSNDPYNGSPQTVSLTGTGK
jgi:hypothetical protein